MYILIVIWVNFNHYLTNLSHDLIFRVIFITSINESKKTSTKKFIKKKGKSTISLVLI